MVNLAFVILGIVLFASAIAISVYMRTYVEGAGYLRCPKADKRMTFSTYLMYTKITKHAASSLRKKEKNKAEDK